MKDYEDAFGYQLHDYLNGQNSTQIIERDDGHVYTNPNDYRASDATAVYFSDYKDWPPHEKKAMRYVTGRVLDIGCGAGKHSLYLQALGLRVLGIDISPLAIEVCKTRGLMQARVMSITQISSELGSFDTILMLGNNFGLFGSVETARRLLKKFHRITRDKARIISQSMDPYDTTNPVDLDYHKLNRIQCRMPGQMRVRIRYRKYLSSWFELACVKK